MLDAVRRGRSYGSEKAGLVSKMNGRADLIIDVEQLRRGSDMTTWPKGARFAAADKDDLLDGDSLPRSQAAPRRISADPMPSRRNPLDPYRYQQQKGQSWALLAEPAARCVLRLYATELKRRVIQALPSTLRKTTRWESAMMKDAMKWMAHAAARASGCVGPPVGFSVNKAAGTKLPGPVTPTAHWPVRPPPPTLHASTEMVTDIGDGTCACEVFVPAAGAG
ncbi:hypothetical protein G7046_g1170 [Stylonectria norvegica]|nr:hypothetical protein G7046_g1170 [Stylonectria norvegica]